MQSRATTVAAYLKSLPADRRKAIEAVRQVILENLDGEYEEGMQYGMIGYYVPHRVYPPGYHCDPKQPLPFAGLASQKNHMALYLMCLYAGGEIRNRFEAAWVKSGRKLDMGKCCVRFRKLEEVALDVIGETIRRVPARSYVEHCEAALKSRKPRATRKREKPAARRTPAKKARRAARPDARK